MENLHAMNIDVFTGAVNPMPKIKDEGDAQLHVMFAMQSHFNDVKTREEQRPVFEMKEYVTIMVPGDPNTIINRPIRVSDIERFPRQYQAFKAGKEQQEGYPLTEWPLITRAQCDELSFFKISTVEKLANVSDTVKQRFMGLSLLSEKARIWLEQRAGEEPALKLQAEVVARTEENEALKARLQMVEEALAELKSKKRGKQAEEQPA
jgi:hypothetical protein